MNGIILLAHGSRDPQWVQPFEAIRAAIQARLPGCATALSYLEHSSPDFQTAVDGMVGRGVDSIRVVPLFLGPGGHVRRDVPQLVDSAQTRHAAIRFEIRPFIGDARTVLDAIADYATSESAINR